MILAGIGCLTIVICGVLFVAGLAINDDNERN